VKTRNADAVREAAPVRQKAIAAVLMSLVAALLVGGIVLGLYQHTHGVGRGIGAPGSTDGGGQDRLAMSSGARVVESVGGSAKTAPLQAAAQDEAAKRAQQAEQAAKQQQQEAAAQQAAQAAELAERNRELEQKAAEQEARERQLQQDRLRLEAERQKAEAEAAAEAERLRQSTLERQSRAAVYSGPSSGDLIWRGEVKGTTLVTINGNSSDSGEVISGALPGVLVMVQPADAKHVGVAGTPAPSNAFHRLTLRIQGNGVVQEVIHWSVP
jgi:hypothetical protein